jgi:hypothetical protein
VTSSTSFSTSGNTPFTLIGTDIDATSTVTYIYINHEYSASCTANTTLQTMWCTCSQGLGVQLSFKLHSSTGSSPSYATSISYAIPTFTAVTAGILATASGGTVTLSGSSFGPAGLPAEFYAASYGPTGNQLSASNCHITTAQTTIECMAGPGVGNGHRWILTIGGQPPMTSPESQTTSYAAATLTSVTVIGGGDMNTDGSSTISVIGTSFGPPDGIIWTALDAEARGTYGPASDRALFKPVAKCSVKSDTSMVCTSAIGAGGPYQWQISIAGRTAFLPSATVQYARPVVNGVSTSPLPSLPTAGDQQFTVTGTQFGY